MKFWRRKKKQPQPQKDQNGVSGRRDARGSHASPADTDAVLETLRMKRDALLVLLGFNLSSRFKNQTHQISTDNELSRFCCLI